MPDFVKHRRRCLAKLLICDRVVLWCVEQYWHLWGKAFWPFKRFLARSEHFRACRWGETSVRSVLQGEMVKEATDGD